MATLITNDQYVSILPEIILSVAGMLVMVVDPLLPATRSRKPIGLLALVGSFLALAATAYQLKASNVTAFFGMVRVDHFSIFFHAVVICISIAVIFSSLDYLDTEGIRAGEYYGLILLGTVGMALMSSAMELVLIFIALEISSISTYILAGFRRKVAASSESSIKYFLLGSFATAFFLYGVSLIFGATGTTRIPDIAEALARGHASGLEYIALSLMIVGMGFKVAAAPFHVWTPDVYEGAPAPVVALMSTGPKAAAFALMLRVLFGAFGI